LRWSKAALLQIGQVHLERRRIHRHQRVELIAGRVDPLAAELELEARHAEERAGGSADLGREIRQSRNVVAGPRCFRGELLAGDLHSVAGIAGKPDDCPGQGPTRLRDSRRGHYRVAHGLDFLLVTAVLDAERPQTRGLWKTLAVAGAATASCYPNP